MVNRKPPKAVTKIDPASKQLGNLLFGGSPPPAKKAHNAALPHGIMSLILSLPSPPVSGENSHGAFEEVFEEAEAACNAGNPIAALDVIYLCAGKMELPAWAAKAAAPFAKLAPETILMNKTGRHARALQTIRDNKLHYERYRAVRYALVRERVFWHEAYERGADLVAFTEWHGSVHTVRRSFKLVCRALKAGKEADFWYPKSKELLLALKHIG